MLALSRRVGETVYVGDTAIKIIRIVGNTVRLGFDAPDDVPIMREEVRQRMRAGEPFRLIEDDLDRRENLARTTSTIPTASLPPKEKQKFPPKN